jgi:hypothetical protein
MPSKAEMQANVPSNLLPVTSFVKTAPIFSAKASRQTDHLA